MYCFVLIITLYKIIAFWHFYRSIWHFNIEIPVQIYCKKWMKSQLNDPLLL